MDKFIKFLKLPLSQKRLYLEVLCLLGLARMILIFIPFKRLASQLGRHMKNAQDKPANPNNELITNISAIIRTMSRFTPWESRCFVQAITARWMLRRRGIGGTLYLGLAKESENSLKAHAWFKSGEIFVTGKNGCQEYRVISYFTM